MQVPLEITFRGLDPSDFIERRVRDAFRAAGRRLGDALAKREGKVKRHQAPAHGRIARLSYFEGYGFIEAAAGAEVYFHRNAVTAGRFEDLQVGDAVRFSEAEGEGDQGPQASAVTPLGKRHIVE